MSAGGIAFTGSPPGATVPTLGARLGVIPVDPVHLALAAVAGAIVAAAGWPAMRGRAVAIAVAPLALVFLPWLPFPVPAAFLAWRGALAGLAWTAAVVAVAAAARPAASGRFSMPKRQPLFAGVAAAMIFAAAAWGSSPSLPGGDEPHYLVITQSLLHDGDIRIENNHRQGDYRRYFPGDLPPHAGKRGVDGQMYSIHAPGVAALVLPAFAAGGYAGVVAFLVALSAAGCALAWWLAWRATGSAPAAWFGWAVVTVAAPFLLESFTVFPDGPAAVLVLTGFWALLRAGWERDGAVRYPAGRWWPWALHGMALALLPWLHTRLAVIAGTLGGLILVRIARAPNPMAKAIAFLSVPALSALAWLFFFTIVYGAPDPSAPYFSRVENSFAFLPNGLGGLLFDQGFGLLATAPVLVAAFAGFARTRRFALEWAIVAAPYVVSVATFAMWWAGASGPARFLVPLLLPLAVPAACAWSAVTSRGARCVLLAALLASAWLAAVLAGGGGGRLGYHTRNMGGLTAAPWLQWATPVVDLPAAFPAFVPQPVQPDPGGRVSRARAARDGFTAAAMWIGCLGGAAAFLLWLFRRRPFAAAPMIAITTVAFAAAAMLAMSMVWTLHASERVTATAAQLDVLRRLANGGVVAFDLSGRRVLTPEQAFAMRITAPVRRTGGRLNQPLVAFPGVPAGSYVLSVQRHGRGDGWLMIGVGDDQFAIATQPIGAFDAGVTIDLPVPVRGLLVRGDEGARDQLQAVDLRPIAGTPRAVSRDVSRRAVRYEGTTVFFQDDRAFPEPSGFWVAGARQTAVAVQFDRPQAVSLLLRNGPVDNVITLESGRWRDEFAMVGGEERRIDLPVDAARRAVPLRIRSAAAFRPSDVDRSSRDTRSLGVFVRVPGD